MARQLPPLAQRFLDRISRSRDLSISVSIHAIIVLLFGLAVIPSALKVPAEFKATEGLVAKVPPEIRPPEQSPVREVVAPDPSQINEPVSSPLDFRPIIDSVAPSDFTLPVIKTLLPVLTQDEPLSPPPSVSDTLTQEMRDEIRQTMEVNRPSGTRDLEFDFTAFLGRYSGGDWNSTVEMEGDQVRTGSLPNLLYLMSHWTKDRVKTNYRNVRAIRLDSDELFTVRPPFIFLTGTRDFILTEREVENLRRYIRIGGCIWGDSSVPGERSRFDLAFRREMKRVVGGDGAFEPLPSNHPLFTKARFPEVKGVPKGLNSYQLPVYALKAYGEIAVLYTANDYGDMWQIGLDAKGAVDLRRDAKGRYLAINPELYARREVYARNLSPQALEQSYKFGINIVMHLLTRWDGKVGGSSAL